MRELPLCWTLLLIDALGIIRYAQGVEETCKLVDAFVQINIIFYLENATV